VHVAAAAAANCTEHDDDDNEVAAGGYLEALEHETATLQKRVAACRSRLIVATVFDVT